MAERIERLVFFGTPAFAVPTLDALKGAGRSPLLVVTQPARRSGRGRRLQAPPVQRWAEGYGIEVAQPRTVKSRAFHDQIRDLTPDLVVVVAFGQIFPGRLLSIPRLGCMNLHASLLPAYRGASPIAAAIAAGETVTGVSTMWMEAGLDSGPILLQRRLEIGPEETTGQLSPRLAQLGARLVVETIEALEREELEATAQDSERATFAPLLDKSDGEVDWRRSAKEIFDQIRALDPWPGAFTEIRGEKVRIHRALPPVAGESPPEKLGLDTGCWAGRFLGRTGDALLVGCGDRTWLAITEVQRPGRRKISGADLVNAIRPGRGELLAGEDHGSEAVAKDGPGAGAAP